MSRKTNIGVCVHGAMVIKTKINPSITLVYHHSPIHYQDLNDVNHYRHNCLYYYCTKILSDVPDSEIDGEEDVLHADDDVDAPDAVV